MDTVDGIPAERILIIRPSALGDVCRSVPVLTTLRAAYPGARIDWLVQDTFAPAIERHPALDGVVAFPRRALAKWGTPVGLAAFFEWARCLVDAPGGGGYDLVVDAQGLARSGLFAWMTGARTRLGYANAQEAAGVFYSRRVRVPREWHAVDRMAGLVSAGLGVAPVVDMRLYTGERERAQAAQLLGGGGFGHVVIAPTSRWASKRWPADRFARLAEALVAGAGGYGIDSDAAKGRGQRGRAPGVERVVLVGGESERHQCGALLELARRDARVVDLIGKTSVGVLMAIIAGAALVVANDSAALHMAVGFERPAVGLFGPTDVSRVGPYRREADVIQHVRAGDVLDHKSEAGAAFMERIGVEEVIGACVKRLDGQGLLRT